MISSITLLNNFLILLIILAGIFIFITRSNHSVAQKLQDMLDWLVNKLTSTKKNNKPKKEISEGSKDENNTMKDSGNTKKQHPKPEELIRESENRIQKYLAEKVIGNSGATIVMLEDKIKALEDQIDFLTNDVKRLTELVVSSKQEKPLTKRLSILTDNAPSSHSRVPQEQRISATNTHFAQEVIRYASAPNKSLKGFAKHKLTVEEERRSLYKFILDKDAKVGTIEFLQNEDALRLLLNHPEDFLDPVAEVQNLRPEIPRALKLVNKGKVVLQNDYYIVKESIKVSYT